VGDAGWLLPPDDGDAWTEAMIRVLEDGVERQRLAEAGARHVAGYGWRETAHATVAAYRAALATTPEPATRAALATTAEPATRADPTVLADPQPDPVADPDAAPDPDAAAEPADAPEDGVAS
jgi:hypothetical protein